MSNEATSLERFEASRSKRLSKHPISHDCLRNHAFFKNRDPKLFDLLLNHIRVEVFMPGDDILKEGEDGKTMYFLHRGAVAILFGPELKQVAVLRDGSLFGELALLGNGKRACTVRASEVCDCRVIDAEAFHMALRRFPAEKAYFYDLAKERCKEINKETPRKADLPPHLAKPRQARASEPPPLGCRRAKPASTVIQPCRRKSAPAVSVTTHQVDADEFGTTLEDDGYTSNEGDGMSKDGLLRQTHTCVDNSRAYFKRDVLSGPRRSYCTPQKCRQFEKPTIEGTTKDAKDKTRSFSTSTCAVQFEGSLFCPLTSLQFGYEPPCSPPKLRHAPLDGKQRVNTTAFPTLLSHRIRTADDLEPPSGGKTKKKKVSTCGDLTAYMMGAKDGRDGKQTLNELFDAELSSHNGNLDACKGSYAFQPLPPLTPSSAWRGSSGNGSSD